MFILLQLMFGGNPWSGGWQINQPMPQKTVAVHAQWRNTALKPGKIELERSKGWGIASRTLLDQG
jgi:hypothetical protein